MSDDDWVECCDHGRQQATFVCQHLLESVRTGAPVGFHCAREDEPRSDAWCDACEAVRQAEGGWNDRSESVAGISLLCGACYDRARKLKSGVEPEQETMA